MKLQQLTENKHQIDFEYLEKFREEIGDSIVDFENALDKKGYKIVEFMSEPDDETYLGVVFSNKVLDIMFEVAIAAGRNSGDEILDLDIQFSIADAFAIGAGNTLPTAIKTYKVHDVQPHHEQQFVDGLKKATEDIIELSDRFHDWYLDVTGEYGKVKLYVDHKSKTDKPSIKALAGYFDIDSHAHEVY